MHHEQAKYFIKAIEERMDAKLNRIERSIDSRLNSILEALQANQIKTDINSNRMGSLKRLKEKLIEAYAQEQVVRHEMRISDDTISLKQWIFGICQPDARKGIVGSRLIYVPILRKEIAFF